MAFAFALGNRGNESQGWILTVVVVIQLLDLQDSLVYFWILLANSDLFLNLSYFTVGKIQGKVTWFALC